jgi:hypothetical protein
MSVNNNKEKEELKIKQFKSDFLLEFDREVLVLIKSEKPNFPRVSLTNLEILINELLYKKCSTKYPNGIRTHSRNHDVTNFRYCFYKIAMDMKYTMTFVSRYLGFHHATVLNGRKVINNLIITKDAVSVFNINNIYYELEKRFGINANIYFNEFAKCDTEPVLPTFVYQGGIIG